MDIKNFIKTNRLFLSALLLLVVIIGILLSLRNPSVSYKMDADQVAALLKDSANQVAPFTVLEQVTKGDKSLVLVDIRTSDEFAKGHIGNAVNIPVRELLKNNSLAFFKELKKTSTPAILYGEDQLQANGPWLLLKQVGFSNLSIMQGGYAFYKTLPLPDSLLKVSRPSWLVEMPVLDTAEFRKASSGSAIAVQAEKKETKAEKVVPVKKAASSGGGC